MTTVVFKDGVVAADTRATRGETMILPGHAHKLTRRPDGSIMGICGYESDLQSLVAWLDGGKQGVCPIDHESTILHLQVDGQLVLYENHGWYVETSRPFAMGTGRCGAMGAMLAGASAREAVAISMQIDPFTGGRVETMSLEEVRPSPSLTGSGAPG